MGIIFAVLIAVGYFVCFGLVKEKLPFSERIKVIKGNKPFWGIIISMILLNFMAVFGGTFFSYYCMYNLQHPEWIASLVTIGGAVGIVAALFLVVPFTKKYEKRHLMLLGFALYIVASLLLILIGGYTGAVIYQIIQGAGNAFAFAGIWAAVPDMSDYGAWKNKVNSPGLVYSICMFVLKVVVGFASYGVGAILDATGFDATLGLAQVEKVVRGISISIGIVPAILGVVAIACTFLLKDVDKAKMPLYRQQ